MNGTPIRTIVLLTILVLLGVLVPGNIHAGHITSSPMDDSIILVDKNGGGDYTTIQEAVHNAPEKSTIYIKTGLYNEIIIIKKKITLIGEDMEKTIIHPISEKNNYAIRILTPGVTIKRLSITNNAPGLYTTGIYLSASHTTIENCAIFDTSIGIAIWTSYNSIYNCRFWNCTDEAIALLGSRNSECTYNKITHSVFYNNCDGIELQYSSHNIITNCQFYENTHTGINAIASSNDKNTISNCIIYNNQVNGIYLASSSDNQILDNIISDNKDADIITKNSYNNVIKNTESTTNTKEVTTEKTLPRYQNTMVSLEKNTKNRIIDRVSNVKLTLLSFFGVKIIGSLS